MHIFVMTNTPEQSIVTFYNMLKNLENSQPYGPANSIQWNPSCEATPFAPEMWPFKRGGLS